MRILAHVYMISLRNIFLQYELWDKIMNSIYVYISEFYFSYLPLHTFYTTEQSINIFFIKLQFPRKFKLLEQSIF